MGGIEFDDSWLSRRTPITLTVDFPRPRSRSADDGVPDYRGDSDSIRPDSGHWRIGPVCHTAYLALREDHYPSTDEQQAVHLDLPLTDGVLPPFQSYFMCAFRPEMGLFWRPVYRKQERHLLVTSREVV